LWGIRKDMLRVKTVFLFLLVSTTLAAALLIVAPATSQPMPSLTPTATPSPTPTPVPTPMLLPDESCVTVAGWYGLTPGESTAQDAFTFIQEHSYLFRAVIEDRDSASDPETGYMVNGEYIVCWDESIFDTQHYVQHCNGISLKDGVVDSITLAVNRDVFLKEVLDALGLPDQMVWEQGMSDGPFLKLVYVDRKARVYLTSDFATCAISDMADDFWVYGFEYSASVLPYSAEYERLIPSSLWQAWLGGDMDEPCWVAWRRLEGIPIPTPEHRG
jgi:hypothetical protein